MTDRIHTLKRMLEDEPSDVFCLYSLAQEHTKLGEHEAALQYYDRLLEVDPDHAYAYYHKARVLEEAGDESEAVRVLRIGFQRAIRINDPKAADEIQAYLDVLT